jgi:hypothetical protein
MDVTAYAGNLVQAATQNAQQVQQILLSTGTAIAQALVPYVVTAELSWIGLRMVFRKTIVEELTKFTIHFVILFIVVYLQFPQSLLLATRDQLAEAGRQLGFQLAATSTSQPAISASPSLEPAGYWSYWIGDIQDDTNPNNKLGLASLKARFQPTGLFDEFLNSSGSYVNNLDEGWWKRMLNLFNSILKSAAESLQALINMLLAFLVVLCSSGLIIGCVLSQFGCLLTPALAQIAVLVACQYAFAFALGVGISVVPLMLFAGFRDIWRQYLQFLVGLVLIPPLFYILSGIGFAFATTMYEAMFPLNNFSAGFGQIIQQFIECIWTKLFNMLIFGGVKTALGDIFGDVIGGLLVTFKQFGYFLAASTIVSGFVLAGVSCALAAPAIAHRWAQAFRSEELLHKVSAGFNLVQSSLSAAYGQMYGRDLPAVVEGIGGLIQGNRAAQGRFAPKN